jgi:hypothetical protein
VRRRLNEFAPPGQLNRYVALLMTMSGDFSPSNMLLLQSFRTQNLEAGNRALSEGIKVDVTEIGNLEHKASCSVSIESPRFLGNLTMWVTGECDLLVTDDTAEDVLINETMRLQNERDVQHCIEDTYRRLRDISAGAT